MTQNLDLDRFIMEQQYNFLVFPVQTIAVYVTS
jgi:hypothetical protein